MVLHFTQTATGPYSNLRPVAYHHDILPSFPGSSRMAFPTSDINRQMLSMA